TRRRPLEGCTKSRRSRAECRFFESLANRFEADRIDQPKDDHLVGQQSQGPVAASLGRIATGQLDQLLLDIALHLDLVGTERLGSGVDGLLEPLREEAFANAADGTEAGTTGRDGLVIGALSSP